MFNPYAIIGAILMAIALAWGGYEAGWEKRGDHEAAIALEAKKAADKLLAKEKLRGDGLVGELAKEKRNIKIVTIDVIREIPKVTTVYVEVPGETPKAIPPAVITWGAVGLYNRALRPDLPDTASEFSYPPGATSITRAQVDTPDILAVHSENAGKWAECRADLNKLIDWHAGRAAAPGD